MGHVRRRPRDIRRRKERRGGPPAEPGRPSPPASSSRSSPGDVRPLLPPDFTRGSARPDDFAHTPLSENATMVPGGFSRTREDKTMAPRAARRGVRVVVVLVLGVVVFVTLLVVAGVPLPQIRAGLCGTLGTVVPLDQVLPSCGGPAEAGGALPAGRGAAARAAVREALGHCRGPTAAAPDLVRAHVARGDVAEMLGEYDEALAAFQRAAAIEPSEDTSLRIGAAADRLGRVDLAVQTLEGAYGPWRRHAGAGARAAATNFATCAPVSWANPARLWHMCVNGSRDAYDFSFETSRETVPRWVFRILLGEGRRDRALAFARDRGWLREDVEYCGRHALPIDHETSALLAMLTQPDRADCALATAVGVADDGGARLGRMMLLDRIARSPQAETRERAQYYLRYRLPDHDVPRLAEALHATGLRLQHVHDAPDEALVVFQKAIEADPRFSWPHYNIGRIYMAKAHYEQARVWLERALAVNPDHWRALYNYGVTTANLKRWPEALSAYRKALAISPTDARLHANVGWTLIELGQQGEADRELQIAVRLDPSLQAERSYLNSRYGRDARSGPTPSSARSGGARAGAGPGPERQRHPLPRRIVRHAHRRLRSCAARAGRHPRHAAEGGPVLLPLGAAVRPEAAAQAQSGPRAVRRSSDRHPDGEGRPRRGPPARPPSRHRRLRPRLLRGREPEEDRQGPLRRGLQGVPPRRARPAERRRLHLVVRPVAGRRGLHAPGSAHGGRGYAPDELARQQGLGQPIRADPPRRRAAGRQARGVGLPHRQAALSARRRRRRRGATLRREPAPVADVRASLLVQGAPGPGRR